MLLAACSRDRVELTDAARVVLERHCGDCHVPDSPLALPNALSVYNLRDEEWAARMSDAQVEQLVWRIRAGAFFDPYDERNKGKTAPPDPSEAEQAIVRDFAHAELSARRR